MRCYFEGVYVDIDVQIIIENIHLQASQMELNNNRNIPGPKNAFLFVLHYIQSISGGGMCNPTEG